MPIAWVAATSVLGAGVGGTMAHAGSDFALRHRDVLVETASTTDPAAAALSRGFPLRAALLDFARNLCLVALPATVMGLGIVLPFPLAAYHGWVGGIVSVDGEHHSRLRPAKERWYYLTVMVLQLLPYSLAGGAGVRLGLAFLRPTGRFGYPGSARWLGLPADGVRDVFRIYALTVPLFLVASLVEYLAR